MEEMNHKQFLQFYKHLVCSPRSYIYLQIKYTTHPKLS